jgi:hypothetical protein
MIPEEKRKGFSILSQGKSADSRQQREKGNESR